MARTKKISLEEFVAAIEPYRGSRRKNPMLNDEFCAYTDPKNAQRHCIFGTVMDDLGILPIAIWEGLGANELLDRDGGLLDKVVYVNDHDDVSEIARCLQIAADGDLSEFGDLRSVRPWGSAISLVTKDVKAGHLLGTYSKAKAAWLDAFG